MTENDVMELSTKQIMKDLEEALAATRNGNIRKSRTAKLLLLHMQYISIVKEYVLSDRTCNWALHLHTIQKMMNLFAASGHINYAKCPDIMSKKCLHCQMKNLGYTNSSSIGNMQYNVLAATGLVCRQT